MRPILGSVSVMDGLLVVDSSRLVVPPQVKKVVLSLLHQSHCGISKSYEQARQLYYWPGMKADVAAVVICGL